MRRSKDISPQVALLRGINVGGSNLLPMKDLAAMFAEAGCADVRTYIQSGNVVFKASAAVSKDIAARIESQIAERFGCRVPVTLRTVDELRDTILHNPFLKAGTDEKALHVYFLAAVPEAQNIAKLDPQRSAPDAFAVRNREIYLHLPNGMGRSKLTNAYFDSKLATVSTARNWRTILTLFEMLGGKA